MAQLFPETPTVIAAEGDSALCAAALLRVPRDTTRQVVRLLAWRTTKTAGAMAPAVPMTIFDDWSLALQAVLASIDQRLPILQFTAEVAHGVARPAAPLSTFLVGMAAGHDGGTTVNIADALARARTLLAAQDPETS